jgi:hypothetical protein
MRRPGYPLQFLGPSAGGLRDFRFYPLRKKVPATLRGEDSFFINLAPGAEIFFLF